MKTNRAIIVTMVMLCLVLSACTTFLRDSYRTLAISEQLYDTSMLTLADLYKEGVISQEDVEKAVLIGRSYKTAHNSAVSYLLVYDTLKDEYSKEEYTQAIGELLNAISELTGYVNYLQSRLQ